MGCDIHGYWEVKTKEHGWIAVKSINDTRSYSWFGIVGGVRRSVGVARGLSNDWHLRGVPKDASDMWREYTEPWGDDLHSCTWLTPSEVACAGSLYEDDLRFTDDDILDAHYYQAIEAPLEEDDVIDQLYLGMNHLSEREITLAWCLTVKDFRDKSEPFEKTVRMVIGFDN